jgi:catechol 2,3-dioxygenase-like lactoylglutathione lyase family enzyme
MFRYAVPKFPAANVQASLEFYKNKMGFRELFNYGDYAAVKRDAVEIHLWECQDKHIAENTACRVAVDDIDTICRIPASRGHSSNWDGGRKALGRERVRCT